MTDLLAAFGVGGDALAPQVIPKVYPTPVPGRVAHIDADFLSYQVSAETRDELDGIKPRKTLEEMKHNCREAAEELMRLAGATSYKCHITPSGSDKGGRREQAVQREYQATRVNRDRPEHLDLIRHFIATDLNGVVHLDQEADDGMAQANYNARGPGGTWGNSNLSIIVSKDKDLRMVPGLHYDFDTNSVHCVGHPFGTIWIDDTKSSKTLKGWGTKFFWAQCLMGDTADNVRGIPFVTTGMTGGKPLGRKACGPIMAYELLKDVYNDKEAFALVKSLWVALENDGYEYMHWATGERVTATQALLGDMRLLWMRRTKDRDDVLHWLKEQVL